MKQIFEFLKKLAKRKIFWAFLVIIFIVIAIFNLSKNKGPVYVTEKVQRGNLTQTVSETGTIESASAINLNFKGAGTLVEIKVKKGDEVKAGEMLARLDAGSLEIAVRQAKANLDMAQANLNKLLAGASPEELKVSEEQVNNAKIAADNAQLAFNDIQNQSTKGISDARQNLINEINKQIVACRAAMDAIKLVFDNSYLTFQYSVKNPQDGIDAHNYYDEAKVRLAFAETSISNLKASDTESNLSDAVKKLREAQDWIKNALDKTYLGLINTLVGNLYTEIQFNTDKSNISNQQNIINAGIASLSTYDQTYLGAKLNQESNYNQAKANLDSAIGAYNLAKAQYELKKARPREVDIASLQAQVDQARAAYDLALNNLNDYIIYAPTDGIVTFVNYKKGEQISPAILTKPVISMIGRGDYQIKVDVPESDIIKVKVGNPVKVTLDAYGEDAVFTGKVIYIDIAETLISGVVYYKVTVELEPTDKEIKSGMTANVDILTAQKENVLTITARAVKETEEGEKYVEVKKINGINKANVVTGLKGDQGKIEIVSGLQEGDEIIIYKKEK